MARKKNFLKIARLLFYENSNATSNLFFLIVTCVHSPSKEWSNKFQFIHGIERAHEGQLMSDIYYFSSSIAPKTSPLFRQ